MSRMLSDADEWLRLVVVRASTLAERLRSPDLVQTADVTSRARERFASWQSALVDDELLLTRRLRWDRLDAAVALHFLGDVQLRPSATLPPWAYTLREVLQLAESASADGSVHSSTPVPFEGILSPFVAWARMRCRAQAGIALERFEPTARASLEQQWCEWFSSRASRTLLLELQLARAHLGADLDDYVAGAPDRGAYDALVDRFKHGAFTAFFEEYSALARTLATGAIQLAEGAAELIRRFDHDATLVSDFLGLDDAGCRVESVSGLLSDFHHGLRGVAILRLRGGAKVVYKPRSLAIEAGFNALLQQIGQLHPPVDLWRPRAIDCGEYGWVEVVEHAPCPDVTAAHGYCERAGALLALVHVLGGTDLHAGNVIASGKHPVLIDLETLFTPEIADSGYVSDATRLAAEKARRSVISTYMLPYRAGAGSDSLEIAAFAEDSDCSSLAPQWVDVNTDRMRLEMLPLDALLPPRAMWGNGRPISMSQHADVLVHGFEAMYRCLSAHRAELLESSSRLMQLRPARIRIVHRNTSVYDALLNDLRSPDLLREGIDRSLHLERLAVAALQAQADDGRESWIDIWESERDAIEQQDVPYFSATADSVDLESTDGRLIKNWCAVSGHASAVRRLEGLSEEDLRFQVDVIRMSLAVADAIEIRSQRRRSKPADRAVDSDGPGEEALWLDEITAIADRLERSAIAGDDGSVAWLQPRTIFSTRGGQEVVSIAETGNELYDGALGIALFLAAAHLITGRPELSQLAVASIHPVRAELRSRGAVLGGELGVGGLTGLGSVVYGLVALSRLLRDPTLLADANLAASLISTETLDRAQSVDVASGAAGGLLGLLALYEAEPTSTTLARAADCARRIIAGLEPAPGGSRAARTLDGRFLTGFSHGAAGIACALLRLHLVSPDETTDAAVHDLLAFEDSTFDWEHNNWPDLRAHGHSAFTSSWCHGAPGIALARLQLLKTTVRAKTRREIDRALEIACATVAATDHLCCGEFGLVDVLATCGEELGRRDLTIAARRRASAAVHRARRERCYAMPLPSRATVRCSGLFRGESGIGYVLLRLLAPGRLPDVLRLC